MHTKICTTRVRIGSYRDRGRAQPYATAAAVFCGGSIVTAEEAGEAGSLFYRWRSRALATI